MKSQRKRHSAEFKAKVALEARRGQKTINEIANRFEAHSNQVAQWKKPMLEGRDLSQGLRGHVGG